MVSESAELIVLKSINNKLQKLLGIFQVKGIVDRTLADFSKSERPQSATDKLMPEIRGDYTISAKGCNKCGGKITWDLYDKETQPYPSHVNIDGELTDCPEYAR